ncbi:hypothetical protein BRC83_00315 [Halobacteriales archaeon QS_1_68_17]|nr:MAG: hypothetical protein BRC83_00315 [Halobacteriales archaeon QS_1_68_17]
MPVPLLVSLVVILGSVTAAVSLAVLAWRQRPKPGAAPFAVLLTAAAWWIGCSSLGLFTVDPNTRLLIFRLGWVGAVVVPPAWLLFALEYTGHDEYVTPSTVAALAAIPATTLAFVLATPGGGPVFESLRVAVYGTISTVETSFGPWFWMHAGFSYLAYAVGCALVLRLLSSDRTVYRGQAWVLAVAVLAPWAGDVVHTAGLLPVPGLNLAPFMFLITGVAGLWGLTQLELLDAVPVPSSHAREFVVERIADGVVVADADGRIVDVNESAADLLDLDPEGCLGQHASEFVPEFDALRDPEEERCQTVEWDRGDRSFYLEITQTPLRDSHDRLVGYVLVVHDVTRRRTRVQNLDVLNRVLRHNLRNEMNFIYGQAERLDDPDIDSAEAAATIKRKAMEVAELGDRAREISRVLDEWDRDEKSTAVGLDRVVDIEVGRVRERRPGVTVVREGSAAGAKVPRPAAPVVRNLLENAVDHNAADDPVVEVTTGRPADGVAELRVRDNGTGIPDAELAILESGRETDLHHASGMGLWLVEWAVRTMNGTITVENDDGAVVTVTVPAVGNRDEETGDGRPERSPGESARSRPP